MNIRCAYADPGQAQSRAEQGGLVHPISRFVQELKQNVKPQHPERIVFAGIVGIPEAMDGRSFDKILAHPAMAFAVDPLTGNGGDLTNRNTAARDVCRRCTTANESECLAKPANDPDLVTGAKPARRFVQVAKGFGSNGSISSICADSYAPAIDRIAGTMSTTIAKSAACSH